MNHRIFRRCAFVFSLWTVASPSFASGALSTPYAARLTTEQLASRVLLANPDLKAGLIAIDAARAGTVTATALPNPRIDVSAGGSRLPAAASRGALSSLTLVQPLENPRLREARREAAQAGLEEAQQRLRVQRNDLVAKVRALALESLMREEESRAHADSLALLQDVRERIKRRVELGEAARYDLIKADAEIIGARQRLEQSELMAEQLRLALNRLANGSLPDGWRLVAEARHEAADGLTRSSDPARLDRNPEIQVLERAAQRSARQIDQARASVLPSIDLSLNHSREAEVRQHALGISVTVPFLDRRQGPIAEALAENLRFSTLLDGRRNELKQEWLIARKGLEMAEARVRALSQGALREAEAAVRIAEAAWRYGERGILDVLDAQRVLRALRTDLVFARFEALAAGIEIDRLEGRHADFQP
jgi:cobalt-zinc-cadmium efflux system outer membrane protein